MLFLGELLEAKEMADKLKPVFNDYLVKELGRNIPEKYVGEGFDSKKNRVQTLGSYIMASRTLSLESLKEVATLNAEHAVKCIKETKWEVLTAQMIVKAGENVIYLDKDGEVIEFDDERNSITGVEIAETKVIPIYTIGWKSYIRQRKNEKANKPVHANMQKENSNM